MKDTPRPKNLDVRVTPPPRKLVGERMSQVDIDQLNETINKIASAVNRSATNTERIPEIQRKVEATSNRVIELNIEVKGMRDRVTTIERKVDEGHACQQAEIISELKESQREAGKKIETDVQHGIRQAGEIALLQKEASGTVADVEDIKKAPRRMFYGFIGITLTVLMGAGGALWFLAELRKDVQHEREQRREQISRIEKQITTVAVRTDPTPVKREIATLTKAVVISNGHEEEFNELCIGMSPQDKQFMRNTLTKRSKRVPQSCF